MLKLKHFVGYSLFLLFLIAACASIQPSFEYKEGDYYLDGDLTSESYRQLIELLAQNQGVPITIHARSNGGKVAGIENAMDAIHQHGQVYWKVARHSKCYSACALLGLSSSKIDGTLYFHSVYSSYKDVTYKLMAKNNGIRTRLISYGYDEALVSQLFSSINIYTKLKFNEGFLEETR